MTSNWITIAIGYRLKPTHRQTAELIVRTVSHWLIIDNRPKTKEEVVESDVEVVDTVPKTKPKTKPKISDDNTPIAEQPEVCPTDG